MKSLGSQISEARKRLKFSQAEVGLRTGLGQPRLSRIEKGDLPASVEVINKIASALGVTATELVAGTDREQHYVTSSASPEAWESKVEMERAFSVFILAEAYGRIYNLFEAIYGGLIGPAVVAEAGYAELRLICQKVLPKIEEFAPGTTLDVFFPDHIEPADEFDWRIEDWHSDERARMKQSERVIIKLELEFKIDKVLSPEARTKYLAHLNFDKVDIMIESLLTERKRMEAHVMKTGSLAGL